ncbi:MAG: hypothetical protein R3C44_12335 [Chloroflexota bacterium]
MSNKDSLANNPFDDETWALLPDLLGRLPEAIVLQMWGDENGTRYEQEALRLCRALADEFSAIDFRLLPRRVNYPYYPVIGVLAGTMEQYTDPGVRIIGLPTGYQLTTLIAALQTVSFRAQTLEPGTRIRLHTLEKMDPPPDVRIEVLTSAEDEEGTLIAKHAFGLAVASPRVRSFAIMTDCFPEAAMMYSAAYLPHTVINGQIHYDGALGETELLRQIGLAVGS